MFPGARVGKAVAKIQAGRMRNEAAEISRRLYRQPVQLAAYRHFGRTYRLKELFHVFLRLINQIRRSGSLIAKL